MSKAGGVRLPLEDNLGDVLSKAQRGLGLSTEVLAEGTGLAEGQIRALRRGEYEAEAAARLAAALGLRVDAVARLGEGQWRPKDLPPFEGFALFPTPFHEGWANACLVWEPRSGRAVAVDAGTNASAMLTYAREAGLRVEAVLLTHAHADHVGGLEALGKAGAKTVCVSAEEPRAPAGAQLVEDGFRYELGSVSLRAIATPGHTVGGLSYLVEGLELPVAAVGDALFSCSMGGTNASYEQALASVRRLLALPPETILAPGHGPATTVAEERVANCFWTG